MNFGLLSASGSQLYKRIADYRSARPELHGGAVDRLDPLSNANSSTEIRAGSGRRRTSGGDANVGWLPLPGQEWDRSSMAAVIHENVSAEQDIVNLGTVSEAVFNTADLTLVFVCLPLSVIGVVLNAMNVSVHVQPVMQGASSTYLSAMCLAQLLYLLLSLVELIPVVLYGPQTLSSLAYLIITVYVSSFVQVVLRRIAFTLTVVVSFERFVAVAFPLRHKLCRFSNHPSRTSAVFAVVISVSHLNLPFRYDILYKGDGRHSMIVKRFSAENEELFMIWSLACRIAFAYLPVLATLLLNILTAVFLRRHRMGSRWLNTNRQVARTERQETQTTVAIVVSSLVFVLFSLPSHIISLVQDYHPTFGWHKREHFLYLLTARVFSTLQLISNFLDFPVYLRLSQRFRRTFKRLFCRGCCSPPPASRPPDEEALRSLGSGGEGVELRGLPGVYTIRSELPKLP